MIPKAATRPSRLPSASEKPRPDVLAETLCQRALLAMARTQWNQAEAFASQARTVLRRAG